MKKVLSTALAVILVAAIALAPAAALDYTAYPSSVEFFFSSFQGVRTNGETTVILLADGVVSYAKGSIESGSNLYTSLDWTNVDLGAGLADAELFYAGGKFIVFTPGVTFTSADGASYERHTNELSGSVLASAATENGFAVFVQTGNNARIYYSEDGLSFSVATDIYVDRLYTSGGNFVVDVTEHGDNNGIYVSSNGVDFTKVSSIGQDVMFYDGAYHAVSYNSDGSRYLLASSDLSSFSSSVMTSEQIYPSNATVHNTSAGVFFAYSDDGAKYALSGGSWSEIASPIKGNLQNVRYNLCGEYLIAYTYGGTNLFYAVSGSNQNHIFLRGLGINYIVYNTGDELFYISDHVSGRGRAIYTSRDGVTFTEVDSSTSVILAEMTFAEGESFNIQSPVVARDSIGEVGNEPIVATTSDGKQIAYEYSTCEYVEFQGNKDFFMIRVNPESSEYFVSKDAVNKTPVVFDTDGRVILGKDVTVVTDKNGRYYSVPNSVLKESIPSFNQKVSLNDVTLSFGATPANENDSLLVPLRFLFERAGATVSWNGETSTATVSMGDMTVSVTKDSNIAIVGGEQIQLNVPARLIDGKTMVPLRFISENIGFDVNWDPVSFTAMIYN